MGTGAPGGIGRVEQMIAEAALAADSRSRIEVMALWRRRHPEYLREGALAALPTVGSGPATNAWGYPARLARAIREVAPEYVLYTHANLARPAPWLRTIGHPARYGVWTYGIEVWERLSYMHRLGLRRATTVLTISRFSAERTVEAQGVRSERVRVIPLTVPERSFDTFAGESLREPGRILTVARLARTEADKGLDQLIKAMPDARKRTGNAHLVIVGEGDDRGRLLSLAAQLGVEDAVSFAGRVSDTELDRQYRRAELFVLPSAKEGFGLVFIEAMLRGTPVIGLAVGGPLEVVRHNIEGLLLDDIEHLPEAIASLLMDRDRLDRMGAAAWRGAAERFSPLQFRDHLLSTIMYGTGRLGSGT